MTLAQLLSTSAGTLVGTTRAKVNEAAMWTLAAEKLYGSYVDVPVVATREALQNSRDAIQKAIRSRKLAAKDAEFRVTRDPASRTLSWADNGIGMTREVVSEKFLSLGDTTKIATAQRNELQAGALAWPRPSSSAPARRSPGPWRPSTTGSSRRGSTTPSRFDAPPRVLGSRSRSRTSHPSTTGGTSGIRVRTSPSASTRFSRHAMPRFPSTSTTSA